MSAAGERAGHDGIAAAHARKSCRLAVRADLDRALLGAFYLIDAARKRFVLNEIFVCRVVEDDGVMPFRIVHPRFELFLGISGAVGLLGEQR